MRRIQNGMLVGLMVCCAALMWSNWRLSHDLQRRIDRLEERLEETAPLQVVQSPPPGPAFAIDESFRKFLAAAVQTDFGTAWVRSQYPIQTSDVLLIQSNQLLPNRPVEGERLVRQDGTIDLGFYGQLQVAGLKLPEVEAKVRERLKQRGATDPAVQFRVGTFNDLRE